MHRFAVFCVVFLSAFLVMHSLAADFEPDPLSVQREGPAYRYPQNGWIVLHIEGDPYDRGVQHGKLMWREIVDFMNCSAAMQSNKSPTDAWKMARTMTDALFVRRFDPELLEEMKGIADGAAAAGAKFDGRALDLTDIVAINVWPEIMTLDWALRAEPTGLEGKSFDKPASRPTLAPKINRCSAFAATGPATKDGKAIIGHITMDNLYACNFYNVWLDIKPSKGHRLVIQGAPGSVQSGMDWYINDAGIVLTETTIAQTRYDPGGQSIGSRSRHSMQYGDSIDSVVKLLGEHGNGLYTNEWLLADMKSNEIALYELGTATSRLMRSSKDEWFGGTKGFYWGCNNTKDLAVRMETIPAANDRPADMNFCPEPRDVAWAQWFKRSNGSIDSDFAKRAFGAPPLAGRGSCDAKYTTADMALQLKSFAHWGDPYGTLWEAQFDTREKYPGAKPIVPCDWTVLTTKAPAPASVALSGADSAVVAADLKGSAGDKDEDSGDDSADDDDKSEPAPAWHGTILPAGDGDVWLASGFARFHDYVAHERQLLKDHARDKSADKEKTKNTDIDADLTRTERNELAVELFGARSSAMAESAVRQGLPLRKLIMDPSDDTWARNASGRGVMLLAELRRRLGPDAFDAAMDAFGRQHAGQAVSSDAFVRAMANIDGAQLNDFFSRWLDSTEALPTLALAEISCEQKDSDFVVTGQVLSHGGATPTNVDVTVETKDDETTSTIAFAANIAKFQLKSEKKPTRLVVNKYGQTPCSNGSIWSSEAFMRDLDHTLIVYGTRVDAVANRIAAEKLQHGIIDQWAHTIVPIKADTEIHDDDLRDHHLLLVGRPACSELIARLSKPLPATFGSGSFIACGQTYANAESALIATGANPEDSRFSVVCIAGLGPRATLRAAEALPRGAAAPLKILPARGKVKDVVPPAVELARDIK